MAEQWASGGRDRDAKVAAALEELGGLLKRGADAAANYEHAWKELREIIQETARISVAEARRLHDEGLMLSPERSMNLVVGLAEALRRWVSDPATWAGGPEAVVAAVGRELQPLLNPGRVLEGDVIEGEP